jgi:hypothetical protein
MIDLRDSGAGMRFRGLSATTLGLMVAACAGGSPPPSAALHPPRTYATCARNIGACRPDQLAALSRERSARISVPMSGVGAQLPVVRRNPAASARSPGRAAPALGWDNGPSAIGTVAGQPHVYQVNDGVPQLNVEEVCEGIAQQGGVTFHDPAIAKEKKECLEGEQAVRDELTKRWSSFIPTDKTSCVYETRMGGESSYTELITCLEMARGVRKLHEEAGLPGHPPQTIGQQ